MNPRYRGLVSSQFQSCSQCLELVAGCFWEWSQKKYQLSWGNLAIAVKNWLYTQILSLLDCLAFIFCHRLTFIHYIEVYYRFVLLDCVRYNVNFMRFVISRFSSTHFTLILAGLTNIICYTKDYIMYNVTGQIWFQVKLF